MSPFPKEAKETLTDAPEVISDERLDLDSDLGSDKAKLVSELVKLTCEPHPAASVAEDGFVLLGVASSL